MEMSILLFQGIDLMLAGMFTVFLFLCILIISINLFAYLLRDKPNLMPSSSNEKKMEIDANHIKIIRAIETRIRDGK